MFNLNLKIWNKKEIPQPAATPKTPEQPQCNDAKLEKPKESSAKNGILATREHFNQNNAK
jgi:hypothetical protein